MSDGGDDVLDTRMQAVASYWNRNKSSFGLGHLERKVFSWSVPDIFNRDLLRHQVTSTRHLFVSSDMLWLCVLLRF